MAKTEKFGVLIEGRETVSRATKKASTGLKGMGAALNAVKLKLIAFTAAMYTAVRVISSTVRAYAQHEQAVARLSQALKNQNQFTQTNIDALTNQANALQKVTIFGNEQIISAQAMLASFALTSKQLKEMTPRLLDVATMTAKTTGGMMDLEGAAKFVGMALGGQAGRLTQAGIRLNDYQKASFQAANETERFNMLIEIFDQNAAGLALSVGETATGALNKFANAFGDLKKAMGKEIIESYRTEIELLTKAMESMVKVEKEIPVWRQDSIEKTSKLNEIGKNLKTTWDALWFVFEKDRIMTAALVKENEAYGNAMLERYNMLQKIAARTDESITKEDQLNKIISDAVKIGKGRTEADRLQIQTKLDLNTELENYIKQVERSGEIDDKKIKKIMEMVAALEKLKGVTKELTELERERAAGVTGLDPGQGRAPRAVDIGGGKWGAPSSDEV